MFDLLPVSMRGNLPDLYEQEEIADPVVHAKFYVPGEHQFWLLTEFDHDKHDVCFGFIINGDCEEFGYFSLTCLQSPGMPLLSFVSGNERHDYGDMPEIIRDTSFEPCVLSLARPTVVNAE